MHYLLKLIIIGDYSVGKSSILSRFTEQREILQDSTIGVDFKCKILDYEENTYKLHIWDTAGLEKFKSIVFSYFRDVDVVFFVYDLTCKKTFENIEKWNMYINNLNSPKDKYLIKFLIGNKTDTDIRCVDYESAQTFAKENYMKYFETSVKDQESVNLVFNSLIITAHENIIYKKINPKTYIEYDDLTLQNGRLKRKSKKNRGNSKCCIIS